MAAFIYQLFTFSSLFLLGLYHLICTTRNFLKSPQSFSAKLFHPFPPLFISPSSSSNNSTNHHPRLKHLQLYLILVCLLISIAHQIFVSSDSDPLIKGSTPVHRFSSLLSAAVLFLFFLLALALLLSESTPFLPLPHDLFFALASASFFLHYSSSASAASFQTSLLQAKCDSLSARISALTSLLCLILAFRPKLFVADAALALSICLHGLWELQTGLSLYVDAFIPEGCHRLLDVVSGVESSTKCDPEVSGLRAVAILDLLFLLHVLFLALILFLTYAFVARCVGMKRLGSYEALPTNATDTNHIQMKALTGTQS
ncbi:uncharacterized protein LOC110812975 [Carica papaya]|uniref:uncharacterized protein LOC110812975 n=1 Tax=Carica papaya TaxID=3649 RepID=UPI000B8C864B|nr:uncharacterized protein LOC110812975 [Carica papaya]